MTARREWSVLARILGLALVAALGACGSEGGGVSEPDVQIVPETPGDPVLPPPEEPLLPPPEEPVIPPVVPEGCTEITLRLRGVNPGDATVYALDVASVEVFDGCTPVPVSDARSGVLDVLRLDRSWVLGRIAMPEAPARLRAVIRLAGATVTLPAGDVLVDPLSPALEHPILTKAVRVDRCRIDLRLDLAGSLAAQGDADLPLVFLPRFGVRY